MARANREHQGRRDRGTKAIVYDPSSHQLWTEDCNKLDSKYTSFQLNLPWWRNRMDIYVDPETKTGFVATVQLDRLGKIKNLQRRVGQNYTVLLVKGSKPNKPSPSPSTSSVSMEDMIRDGFNRSVCLSQRSEKNGLEDTHSA